jgi:quinol monooxygenase YgiN
MTSASTATETVTKGLLVWRKAKTGQEDEVERFLTEARPLVEQEPNTTAWFGVRFGRGEFGIFDVFPDDAGRDAHLHGAVANALSQRGDALFSEAPRMDRIDILATKLPTGAPAGDVHKGLLMTFAPKAGHESDVEQFLRGGREIVEEEDGTLAWFALKFEDGRYGIFDVFPDTKSRLAHLAGRVPRELAKHAASLWGSVPDMDKCDVLAAKLAD